MNLQEDINQLNPMQKKAVLNTEGPMLVLAGAGSGKTSVITVRTAHLLNLGTSPLNVLAVTFTNKSAQEMKKRVSSLLGRGNSKGLMVSTFHSLCLSILRHNAKHIGYKNNFSIFDTSDQLSVIRNILSDMKFVDKNFKADSILEKISLMKNSDPYNQKNPLSLRDELYDVIEILYPRYVETVKTLNAMDFDDLLVNTLKLFKEFPEILEKYSNIYRYIMVDEYQDTNTIQYELIKQLSRPRENLCVVGDDDQSVYAWRGANPGNILNFEKDYPEAVVIRLEQNYRSTGNILKVANSVIKHNIKRMEKTLWTDKGEGAKVYIMKGKDEMDEAEWIAQRIATLSMEKNLPHESFAIMYRANIFSKLFEAELRNLKIPYTVIGGTSYFDRKEIRDIVAYLKLIANPDDAVSLLRIANIPRRGLGNTAIIHLKEYAEANNISLFTAFQSAPIDAKAAKKALEFTELITHYKDIFSSGKDLHTALASLIKEINYNDYVYSLYKSNAIALKRIENVDGFIETVERFSSNGAISLSELLEKLALNDNPFESKEAAVGVTLISLHSAKGLEFPVVFIAGIEDGIIPHKKSVIITGGLEEERRLFYVGVTRAMNLLFLTYTSYRKKFGKSSPSMTSVFIDELPKSAIKYINRNEEDNAIEDDAAVKAHMERIKKILG
jgi:DNA helicase-2/ATP-dependent DNA helicase PcrA